MKVNLYNKLLGLLIKKGKKIKAKLIIDTAFNKLQKSLKLTFIFLLNQLFVLLNTFVESKTIKIKRRTYTIPFPVPLKRRIHLVLKWLIFGVLTNNKKISFSEKLFDEVYSLIKNKSSKSLSFKKENLAKAVLNRSNAHFRW